MSFNRNQTNVPSISHLKAGFCGSGVGGIQTNGGNIAVSGPRANSGSTNSGTNQRNWDAILICNSVVKTTIRSWAFSWRF